MSLVSYDIISEIIKPTSIAKEPTAPAPVAPNTPDANYPNPDTIYPFENLQIINPTPLTAPKIGIFFNTELATLLLIIFFNIYSIAFFSRVSDTNGLNPTLFIKTRVFSSISL